MYIMIYIIHRIWLQYATYSLIDYLYFINSLEYFGQVSIVDFFK